MKQREMMWITTAAVVLLLGLSLAGCTPAAPPATPEPEAAAEESAPPESDDPSPPAATTGDDEAEPTAATEEPAETPEASPPAEPDLAGPAAPDATPDYAGAVVIADLPGDPIDALQTTDSGLQFAILEKGTGPQPADRDTAVSVHYTGWFLNGEPFDSTTGPGKDGKPACFLLGGVIPGWTEGVGAMQVGERRKLVIPGDLAYGPGGRPGIPPNATLVFDVELVGLNLFESPGDVLPGLEVAAGAEPIEQSGLTYYVVREGEGEQTVSEKNWLNAQWAMFLVDGTELSGSRGTATGMSAAGDGLFPGMKDVLAGMRTGGRRKILVPPERAYGLPGRPPAIPPRAMLVLDIEVEAIDPWAILPDELPGEAVTGDPVLRPTGVQVYDLEVGTGEVIPPRAEVHAKMTCWMVDGREILDEELTFDSANPRISGWTEGFDGMRIGGRRKIVVPPNRAYGLAGRGSILPNATLIVDVTLIQAEELATDPADGG